MQLIILDIYIYIYIYITSIYIYFSLFFPLGHNFGLYIPSGALWGAQDIQKMDSLKLLGKLTITMAKEPNSLKVEEPLMTKLKSYLANDQLRDEFEVYSGKTMPYTYLYCYYYCYCYQSLGIINNNNANNDS